MPTISFSDCVLEWRLLDNARAYTQPWDKNVNRTSHWTQAPLTHASSSQLMESRCYVVSIISSSRTTRSDSTGWCVCWPIRDLRQDAITGR
ncbi:hypothetical protein AMECASPLE_039450 [Ameca splendens]|uniref:Uncharacterized protein n=1 Tax=Ameca splendens TaxID=208324 RepID=A0ABV1AHH5_9TELE